MKKAFTLVEILIVVALLGILAAITMPMIKDYVEEAKESAAKDNLRILRNAIELYASQHNGVAPGYPANDPSGTPNSKSFNTQIFGAGKYLSNAPVNPFNEITTISIIPNSTDFPTEPTMTFMYGWVYKPATKTIKLNWSGTDSKGTSYYEY